MARRLDVITTVAALALAMGGAAAWRVPAAHANSSGRTGRSGKQGSTCQACHGGGVAPMVSFSGPAELGLGEPATYHFEVESRVPTQRAAGFNVAASAETLATLPQQGERLSSGELTHTAPKGNTDGVAGWDFTWTAPNAPGTYTLFGAGNSVNLNGQPSGDRSSTTTFDIVVADVETPTPTATPLPPTPTATASATATATQVPPTDTPPPTHTPTTPSGGTPTATRTGGAAACAGDCNADGTVAVNELITGVNIVLGSQPLTSCSALDPDHTGTIGISALIAAVNRALAGCA
jgi:hypothetical protein